MPRALRVDWAVTNAAGDSEQKSMLFTWASLFDVLVNYNSNAIKQQFVGVHVSLLLIFWVRVRTECRSFLVFLCVRHSPISFQPCFSSVMRPPPPFPVSTIVTKGLLSDYADTVQ